MTDEQWIELGRRVVACKHWRWMPGMAWVIPPEARGIWPKHLHRSRSRPVPEGVAPVPDLRDPATLGCLLALVREALGCPVWCSLDVETDALDENEYVPTDDVWWSVWRARDGEYVDTIGSGPTEAAALVAALEAAGLRAAHP